MAGLKRMLGKEALVQFFKGLAKLVIVGAAMASAIWPERARLEMLRPAGRDGAAACDTVTRR